MEMRKKLAKLLRRLADRMDPPDLRPNYKDIKILSRRTINPIHLHHFIPNQQYHQLKMIKDLQKREIMMELEQYMVIDHRVYSTHDLIETRISVLVE